MYSFIISLFLSISFQTQVQAAETANRVLLLYNANYTKDSDGDGVQDSLEVANYYAQVRGVPSSNILGINASVTEVKSYNDFSKVYNEFLVPIQTKLTALGQSNIDIIVFSYGLPYKYVKGATVASIDSIASFPFSFKSTSSYFATSNTTYINYSPNFITPPGPFEHAKADGKHPMYMVTRLDGPLGVAGALDMIDRAVYAEKYAYTGNGYFNGNIYVDDENRASSKPYTDSWLASQPQVQNGDWSEYTGVDLNVAYTENYVNNFSLGGAGLTLKWQDSGPTIGAPGLTYDDGTSAETAPNALMYAGWYNVNDYKNVFGWLPGAAAMDEDSTSLGYPIQSPYTTGWSIQALEHGVTVTCGAISEPYITGINMGNIIIWGLLNGYSFAEASTQSAQILANVTMCLGDPLYTPFAPGKPAIKDTNMPTINAGPTLTQTVLGGVQVSGIQDTIPGQTQPVSLFTLGYQPIADGTPSNFGNFQQQVAATTGYGRRLNLTALNLAPSTTYYYQVQLQGAPPNYLTSVSPSGFGTFTTPAETPYASLTIPGTIPLWQFDNGEEGMSWHSPEPGTISGQKQRTDTDVTIKSKETPYPALSNLFEGFFTKYTTTVSAAGNYTISLYACDCTNGSDGVLFHLEVDGVNVTGPVTMPAMNQKYGTITMATGVHFSAGQHILTLKMDTAPGAPGLAPYTAFGDFQYINIE